MYATVQDMKDRFEEAELIQLSDSAMLGEIDEAKINRAIDDATNEINGYLAKHYKLPMSPVPPVLVRFTCDIARFRLYLNRADMPEIVSKSYSDALAYFVNISKGIVALEAEGVAPKEEATILTHFAPRLTGRDKMGGF